MIRRINDNDRKLIYSIIKEHFNIEYTDNIYTNWYIYEEDNNILGFINYDVIYDKSQIEYIYVDKKYRKKGIATKLLKKMIEDLELKEVTNITLEVRKSNYEAINFYKKNRFIEVATRNNYYNNEDAILMMRSW